jgi:hypothetical protein
VSLNVTAGNPTGPRFVTVYPCGDRSASSSLNDVAGQIVPNSVITPVSANREVCSCSLVDTDLIADINGWFAVGWSPSLPPLATSGFGRARRWSNISASLQHKVL